MIEWLNHWGDAWARQAVLIVVQNTLFLGFLFGLLELLKRHSARLRYTVALTGLAKLVLPLWLPLPAKAPLPMITMETPIPAALPLSALGATPVAPPKVALSSTGWLLALWLVGAAALILIPVIRTVSLHRRLRNAEPWGMVPLGQRAIAVLRTSHVPMPMVLGLWPQAIYVTWQWPAWTPRCQAIALGHELAHIRRGDGLASALGLVVQALYFFHPLVWMLGRRIHALREMACDDAAQSIEQGCTSISYSRALVEIAERMVEPEWTGVSASALIKRKHELLNRIQYQMEAAMRQTSIRVKAGLTLALVLLFAALSWTQGKPQSPSFTEDMGHVDFDQTNNSAQIQSQSYDKAPEPKGGWGVLKANLVYPKLSENASIEGQVMVYALIDTTGKVLKTSIAKSDNESLNEAAMTAVRKTEWIPAKKEGAPAQVQVMVPIIFKDKQDNVTNQKSDGNHVQITDAPPPPPPQGSDVMFYSYDKAPEPQGGWKALAANVIYPQLAEKAGIEGQVMLYAHIDTTGKVLETRIIKSPNEALNEASINAVKKTEWIPAKKGGHPVSVWVMVPIVFTVKTK